jgi:hypothetical protein
VRLPPWALETVRLLYSSVTGYGVRRDILGQGQCSKKASSCLTQRFWSSRRSSPRFTGQVDFGQLPERYNTDVDLNKMKPSRHRDYAQRVLENPELVERIRNYTMMGDKVADAYAALIPDFGFRSLVTMLERACDHGVETVEDAPEELVAFIRAMEATPDWVDMAMVEEGAKHERIPLGTISPFAIRGAFIATFMNKYTALPMTMTGTVDR